MNNIPKLKFRYLSLEETKEIITGSELEYLGWYEALSDKDFVSHRYHFKEVKGGDSR